MLENHHRVAYRLHAQLRMGHKGSRVYYAVSEVAPGEFVVGVMPHCHRSIPRAIPVPVVDPLSTHYFEAQGNYVGKLKTVLVRIDPGTFQRHQMSLETPQAA